MFKGFAVSAAVLLLLSSAAMAQPQAQVLSMAEGNHVGVYGDGAAANINATTAAVDQLVTGPCKTTGYQSTVGSLVQGAGAVGMCGIFDVAQVGGALGFQSQGQIPGIPGTEIQKQDLVAGMDQSVTKIGGQGSALGLQTFVGVQTQLLFNPWGGSANVQGIGVSLYDAVGGGPGGLTAVGGGANVSAGQY
jgi:hypothetical protein